MGHIDDFEISCLGYLYKNLNKYNKVELIICTNWKKKINIWKVNKSEIEKELGCKIYYRNLNFKQRYLFTNHDKLKDKLYKAINFTNQFDILTHDSNDLHTDHAVIHNVMNGLLKHSMNYTTVYSPSSFNFNPNLWISIPKKIFNLKCKLMEKYNIHNEQSYTKSGYYLDDVNHFNIGSYFYIENFVYKNSEFYECYKIIKSHY